MDKQSFIQKYLPFAQQVEKKYNVPVSVTLAQAAIESRWGDSGLTQKANAFFGIKTTKSWGGQIYTAGTQEEENGKKYPTVAAFRKYASDFESFMDYGEFLTVNSRYAKAFKTTNSYDFGTEVAKAGYATDSSYTKLMHDIMRQNNLTQYDGSSAKVESTDFPETNLNTGNKFLDFLGNLGGKVTDAVTDDETGDLDLDVSEKLEEKVDGFKKGTTKVVVIVILVIVVIIAVFLAIKSGGGANNAQV